MKTYRHGENAITYAVFSDLSSATLSRLINRVLWTTPSPTIGKIQYVHLFPNFGKRYGYGEPDVVLITSQSVIYVEVETDDIKALSKTSNVKNLSKRGPFIDQMQRFVWLGADLSVSPRKRLFQHPFIGQHNLKFKGYQRLRRLFMQIKEKDRTPHYLIVSPGNHADLSSLASRLQIPQRSSLGWLSFSTVLNNIGAHREVAKTIRENMAS